MAELSDGLPIYVLPFASNGHYRSIQQSDAGRGKGVALRTSVVQSVFNLKVLFPGSSSSATEIKVPNMVNGDLASRTDDFRFGLQESLAVYLLWGSNPSLPRKRLKYF